MLNYVWGTLVVLSLVFGFVNGTIDEVTAAIFDNAEKAVMNIALPLIGIMAFWLGMLKIAEHSGLVNLLAKALRPLTRFLFPDIPKESPAISSMILNISANWLGLSNAATPFGLKAMEELQDINPKKDTASNAMVTFMALNTAAITFIPVTIMGVRSNLGSGNPEEIIGTTIFAGICATITGVVASKILQRLPVFRRPLDSEPEESVTSGGGETNG
jgi:spore maturation protein A